MTEIGKQFNVSAGYVSSRLRRLGIPYRLRGIQRKHPSVLSLEIGETFLIDVPAGKRASSSIYTEARKAGIRIAMRRVDDQKIVVTRRQLVTENTIREMQEAGMKIKAIADEFMVGTRRIHEILRPESDRVVHDTFRT